MNTQRSTPTRHETVHLAFTPRVYKAVQKAAASDRRTITEFIRLLITDELQKRGVKL